MNSYSKRTTEVNVGTPPPKSAEDIFNVKFHDFVNLLPTEKGHAVTSPKFECLGKQWELTIYPGGSASSDDGNIAVELTLCDTGETEIAIEYEFNIYNLALIRHAGADDIDTFGGDCGNTHEWGNFFERSDILDPSNNLLKNGTLTIEVRMKRYLGENCLGYEPFIPKNPFMQNMQKMFPFMDYESSDIQFDVNYENDPATKNLKLFPAHSIILKACVPILSALCGTNKGADSVPIIDVKPRIFYYLLRYVYGGPMPDKELKSYAKEYINAGDKYGVVNLKLQAETWYCKSTQITTDNVMENLRYAESKNLALLKEAVMSFFMENGSEVISKISLDDLPSSSQSFRDILMAVTMVKEMDETKGNVTNIKSMPVDLLRMKLHENELEVDGTREMLVAALENISKEAALEITSKENGTKRKREENEEEK